MIKEYPAQASLRESDDELSRLYRKLQEPQQASPRSTPGSIDLTELVEMPLDDHFRSRHNTVKLKSDEIPVSKMNSTQFNRGQDPSILSQNYSRRGDLGGTVSRNRSKTGEDRSEHCLCLVI
mmetsp:Transcript_32709/g.56927  ORF Transcript_32709/g.56927 Transcript_32709/m.56927 type:complete len:122 (-) Transcript_32709:2848-3213(-)